MELFKDMSHHGGEVHLRYEALFHNTLDGVIIYNFIKEQIIDCNRAAGTILAYEDERGLIGKSRLDIQPQFDPIYPGVDIHETSTEHGRRVINGESFSTQGVFLGAEGQRHMVKANFVPTFYEPGEAFIIFKDVTNEVLSKKALLVSVGRYKDIYDNSHEGILYIDSNSLDVIMCNNRALDLLGASDIQDVRNINTDLFFLDDGDTNFCPKRMYIKIVRKALNEGRSQFSLWYKKAEFELRRIEGVVVCDNSNNQNTKLIAFIRDVTELYETQSSIYEKSEQLSAYIDSNLQLENFAYLASHDLQTPLRSIICFSQLLERKIGPQLKPSEKELFKHIKSSGESMGEIINQLLLFSKVKNDPLHRTKVDLETLINQLKIEMTSDISKTGARFKFESDAKIIIADRQKIRQLFRNLFSNSLKFTQHSVKPIIQITCEDKPRHWLICVKDNGIGIEQEYFDSIFAMFKKLHIKEEFNGSGFGLTMAKKIVELHEGSIWVESLPGHGTSMYFTLSKKV